MNKLLALMAAGGFALATSAFAADPQDDAPMAANRSKRDEDVQYAGGDKKGDDRKAFMKTCLSAKPMAPRRQRRKQDAMCNKKTAVWQG